MIKENYPLIFMIVLCITLFALLPRIEQYVMGDIEKEKTIHELNIELTKLKIKQLKDECKAL